jgi:catechol 2,3-dioxygenase-like lactoylglutathione lyase family enzyme
MLSIVTIGTADLDAARAFYVDGLGWPVTLDVPGEVCFIQVGHGVLLGLWRADGLAGDLGRPVGPGGNVALAINLDTEDEVRALLDRAEAAGGTILKPAQRPAEFAGLHGYFADPDGVAWEVARNPGLVVDPDGTVRFVSG